MHDPCFAMLIAGLRLVEVLGMYLGFGFFLSRFVKSHYRDLPFTWLFLTVMLFPIVISVLGNVMPLSHEWVLASGLGFFVLGMLAERWRGRERCSVSLIAEDGVTARPWELPLYLALLVVFLVLLILPKESMLLGNPAFYDDYDRVRSVLTTAWDLSTPKHYTNPTQNFAYYYFDWYLPGILFRTTSLTLQQAWMVQCVASYIGILSFVLYVALALFRKVQARLFFLLSCTFMGGYEYILMRLYDIPPTWVEWWQRYVPFAKTGAFQVSAFYTSFVWVPHHLKAGILFLLILLLAVQEPTPLRRILIAVLFAGVFGFSAFVFVPAVLSYAAWELWLLRGIPEKKNALAWYAGQAGIVILLCLRLALVEMGQAKQGVVHTSAAKMLGLPFVSFADRMPLLVKPFVMPLQQAVNALGTWGLILSLDLGIIAVLFFCFLLLRGGNKAAWARRGWLPLSVISVLVTALILTFSKSKSSNDLFLRGMLVMQIPMMLGAGFFLDQYVFSRRWLLGAVGVLVFVQCTFLLNEVSVRMKYSETSLDPLYEYMRRSIARDAVIFTDQPNCVDITYYGNRMCFTNTKRVATVLSYEQFPDRYYLTSQQVTEMNPVFTDGTRTLYRVR